jgi:hypothetical protein
MRFRLVVAVVVVAGSSLSAGRAVARRPGEITSDVTVREWPADDAPAVAELGAGAAVVSHTRRQGWVRVTGAARGWVPVEAFAALGDDTEQQRALLARIAAAAAAEGAPEERTDADLMYDALKQQWHGQLPGSATIDKVVAQSKSEADRNRRVTREKVKSLFWKDPFSEQPHRLIPVRREDRDLLAAHPTAIAARPRSDRAGGDGDDRAETARLRAEVAHLKAELARAETDRTECVAEAGTGEGVHVARRHLGGGHAHRVADRVEALNSEAPRSERRRASRSSVLTAAVPAAATPAAATPTDTTVALPPPGWRSSDPRGIIVVPIAEPVPIQAESKPRRRADR